MLTPKKLDFDGTARGSYPYGSLTQASNGNLYGMTQNGGSGGFGVLFEYNLSNNAYSKKLDFDGISKGSNPQGSLIQASNSKLYGMTSQGGSSGYGVLFEYDPSSNTYNKMFDFDGTAKGSFPYGNLLQGSNNKLYGMTSIGGISNYGVLFEYDLVGNIYNKILNFDGSTGSRPYGSLMQFPNGKLYGMTNSGGAGFGVLFEYDPSTNVYIKKLDLDYPNNGITPYGSLIQASNGKLYGMSSQGGIGFGILFEYDQFTNSYDKIIDFNNANGTSPYGSLIQTSNGKLYGMTTQGGSSGYGVLFEYDPATNSYIKKLDFDGSTKGSGPRGNLIETANGKLYGMTTQGGSSGYGVLFEYDPATNSYIKKLDFDGSTRGRNPFGSLMRASNW